jgi:hypothetical protein
MDFCPEGGRWTMIAADLKPLPKDLWELPRGSLLTLTLSTPASEKYLAAVSAIMSRNWSSQPPPPGLLWQVPVGSGESPGRCA